MAKAKATCKCATCGQEFTKIAYKSNSKEADSWEKWAEEHIDECDECREKRIKANREKENKESAKEAKEVSLPNLSGSEKQVAWANTIRMAFYRKSQDEIDKVMKTIQQYPAEKTVKAREQLDDMISFRNWVLKKSDSRFWIDNRNETTSIRSMYRKHESDFHMEIPEEVKEEIETEDVVLEPETKTSATVCEVKATEEAVEVKAFQKDQTVINIAKGAGYRWDGAWKKRITIITGSAEDRLAEIANRLLAAGISVKVRAEYQQKIISGNYEPETTRWVTCIKSDPDNVYIHDLEEEARKISGAARYKSPVKVPASSWEEVMDFARIHDYKISAGAEKVMQAYRDKVTKVSVIKGADAVYKEAETKDVLNSSRDVLEDLKEED